MSLTITNSFVAHSTIRSADMNQNFQDVQTWANNIPTTLLKSAYWVQLLTTNALTSNQAIYRGWSFVQGNGGNGVSKTVTLPNSGFDDTNYTIMAYFVGTKNGSDPTTVVDLGSNNNNAWVYSPGTAAKSTAAFTVQVTDPAAVLSATFRYVFEWIAIGTKA